MKKIFTYILIASSVTALASCAKETGLDEGNVQEGELITFFAKTPDYTVKTILGDESGHRSVTWAEGDSVKVVYGTSTSANALARIDTNGVINVRVTPGTVSSFYATYPYTIKSTQNASGTYTVTIPAEQDGTFAGANVMAAFANAERVFRFYNATAILCFEIQDTDIDKVIVRANDGTPIAGPVELTFDKEDECPLTSISYGSNCTSEITVDINGPGKYYVGLLPNVNLEAGFGFRLIRNNGDKTGILSRTPAACMASEIRTIGVIDDKLTVSGDIFVKKGATGSGASWSDAASPETLYKIVSSRSGETYFDGVTTAWRLGGKNIYIAEGTYNFKDSICMAIAIASGELTIAGGFSETSVGKDLSSYNPSLYPTVFTADEGSGILEIIGGDEAGLISIKGITFSGANIDGDGGALYVSTADSLVFEDCTITENTVTGHGAGIAVFGGRCYFKNCLFSLNKGTTTVPSSTTESDASRNVASHGGAMYLDGAVKAYINACKFRNNSSFAGADIEVRRGADAFIYSTSFVGSSAQAQSYHSIYPGRSINADSMLATEQEQGAVGNLMLYNCTLTKTTSAYSANGGLPQIAPTNYRNLVASCTLYDPAVANFRNNNVSTRPAASDAADLIWVINNQIVNSNGNGINLATSSTQHGFYNILEKGKNSYATLAETDTSIQLSDYTTITFNEDKACYEWTLSPEAPSIQNITRTQMSELVSTNFPEFHAWLMSLNDNPYGQDQNGTVRNPGAFCPGAWDKGM